jgi:cytochrome P450
MARVFNPLYLVLPLLHSLPLTHIHFRRDVATFRNFIAALAGRSSPRGQTSAAAEFVAAARSSSIPEDQILNDISVLFVAGHETTSSALAMALFALASRREWQEELRAEAEGKSGDGSGRLMTAFLMEVLRMWPPVLQTPSRICGRGDGESFFNEGDTAAVSIYAVHHNKSVWNDADTFDPLRFLVDDPVTFLHNDKFLAFGFGPRRCLGASFSMSLMKAFLSAVVAAYVIDPAGPRGLAPTYGRGLVANPSDVRVRLTAL